MSIATTNEASFPRHCINRGAMGSTFIVVMGVSGTGKSTLGRALAQAMQLPFIDGDDLHSAASVAKMTRGEPLEDVDRMPWLERIRECAGESVQAAGTLGGVIVACSALKRAYRDVLRGTWMRTVFVYLEGEREVLMVRMREREGHFMKAEMLESQLGALESPEGEEGVVSVSVEMSTEEQVERVMKMMIAVQSE